MLAIIASAALVGATLALRFNILVLIPTTIFLLSIVSMGLVVSGHDIWWVAVVTFATAASLQSGYLGTSLLQMLVPGRIERRTSTLSDRRADSEAPPLAPHQPDGDVTSWADDPTMIGGRYPHRGLATWLLVGSSPIIQDEAARVELEGAY
jgi:hypothetical protein